MFEGDNAPAASVYAQRRKRIIEDRARKAHEALMPYLLGPDGRDRNLHAALTDLLADAIHLAEGTAAALTRPALEAIVVAAAMVSTDDSNLVPRRG